MNILGQEVQIVVYPESTAESFEIRIVVPVADVLTRYSDDGERGLSPLQEGGRLLLYDSIMLGNQMIEIMLTLHRGAKESLFRIVGVLSGMVLPKRILACLDVDQECYEAEVKGGRVEFPDVSLSDRVHSISVRLTTDDHEV
jgi:hypothetical protein